MSLNGFDYKLSWDNDFPQENRLNNKPASKEELYSGTHSAWKHSVPKFGRNGKRVIITNVNVTIYLFKKDNWVIRNKMIDELLKHEQGHYDITALLAREYYNRIKKVFAPSVPEMNEKLRKLDEEFEKKYTLLHTDRYDKQTAHGANKNIQEMWNQKIAAEKQKPDGNTDSLP
jgi:hypothetical protein